MAKAAETAAAAAETLSKSVDLSPLAMTGGIIAAVFIGLLGIMVLWKIYRGDIDLKFLISDADGNASLSRFQFLIFTFVIAMGLLLIVVHTGKFPKIDPGVWALLGISGGSYVISKGIQNGGKAKPKTGQAPAAGAIAKEAEEAKKKARGA